MFKYKKMKRLCNNMRDVGVKMKIDEFENKWVLICFIVNCW